MEVVYRKIIFILRKQPINGLLNIRLNTTTCTEPGMSPRMSTLRAGTWTYCLFTPLNIIFVVTDDTCQADCKGRGMISKPYNN